MPPTLIATVGASDANSYVTLSEANAFIAERPHTEPWFEPPDLVDQRPAALITATRLLDEQVSWYGRPATTTQALAWPQLGQVDAWGRVIVSTVVPVAVQRATAYYALALLREMDQDAATVTADLPIKSKKMGDLTITYQDQGTARAVPAASLQLPTEVRSLLRGYGTMIGGFNVPLVRV